MGWNRQILVNLMARTAFYGPLAVFQRRPICVEMHLQRDARRHALGTGSITRRPVFQQKHRTKNGNVKDSNNMQ